MPQGLPFCPHCGAPQWKGGARFCHACGRPIPAVMPQPPAPPELPSARRRRLNPWWLLPLLLAVALAAAALAWELARTRVSDAFAAVRQRVTEAETTPRPSIATLPATNSAGALVYSPVVPIVNGIFALFGDYYTGWVKAVEVIGALAVLGFVG